MSPDNKPARCINMFGHDFKPRFDETRHREPDPDNTLAEKTTRYVGDRCERCGAWRGRPAESEPTP